MCGRYLPSSCDRDGWCPKMPLVGFGGEFSDRGGRSVYGGGRPFRGALVVEGPSFSVRLS